MNKKAYGFTIVEILVVIAVVALLAAVTVVAYIGVQGRSHNTAVQSDLRNAGDQALFYELDHGSLPNSIASLQGKYRLEFTGDSYTNAAWCHETGRLIIAGTSTSGQGYTWDSVTDRVQKADGNVGACATFGIYSGAPNSISIYTLKSGTTGNWTGYVDH